MVGQRNALAVGAAEGYDDSAGGVSLDVSCTVLVSCAVLGLANIEVVELVDTLCGLVGPGCVVGSTHGDVVEGVGVGIIARTSKIYAGDTGTTCYESPDLTALSGVQRGCRAVYIGIMGLIPKNGISRSEVGVGIVRSSVAAAGSSSILDAPVGAGVCDIHQLGVHAERAVNAAVVQNLTVSVDLFVGVLGLYLLERVGPEIGLQTGNIVSSLDVLGSVETEAVAAGSDQFIHVIIDSSLDTAVFSLQIRQTGGAVTGKVIGRLILAVLARILFVGHLCPGSMEQLVVIDLGLKLSSFGGNVRHRIGAGVGVVTVFGTHVVDDSVGDDLYAELVSVIAHSYKLSLCTECVVGALVELEACGLIEHPPTVRVVTLQEFSAGCALLDLVGRRDLNGGKALFSNLLELCVNVSIGPCPRLQDGTVVNGIRESVTGVGRGLSQHLIISRSGNVGFSAGRRDHTGHYRTRKNDSKSKQDTHKLLEFHVNSIAFPPIECFSERRYPTMGR